MKILKVATVLIAGTLGFVSTFTNAGYSNGGYIHNIGVHYKEGGTPVLMFSTTHHVKASCDGKEVVEWAIALDDYGKSVYSLILSAHAQKKPVNVHGTNTCGAWPDREAFHYIRVLD